MESSPDLASTTTTSFRDLRPLILCGPSVLEVDALMRKLWDFWPESFTITTSYTTRQPAGREGHLETPYHLSSDDFQKMVTNGDFAAYNMCSTYSCGISKQTIAEAAATQRIAVIEANMRTVQQLKMVSKLNARYVFITPPSLQVSEARLTPQHSEAGEIQIFEPLRRAIAEVWHTTRIPELEEAEIEYARIAGIYDLILSSDSLDDAFQSLKDFITSSDYPV